MLLYIYTQVYERNKKIFDSFGYDVVNAFQHHNISRVVTVGKINIFDFLRYFGDGWGLFWNSNKGIWMISKWDEIE